MQPYRIGMFDDVKPVRQLPPRHGYGPQSQDQMRFDSLYHKEQFSEGHQGPTGAINRSQIVP